MAYWSIILIEMSLILLGCFSWFMSFSFWIVRMKTFGLYVCGWLFFYKASMEDFTHDAVVEPLRFTDFFRVFDFIFWKFLFGVTRVLILIFIFLVRIGVSHDFQSFCMLFRVFSGSFTFCSIWFRKHSFCF